MFGKLLKYDLKATGRVIPIVMGASLLMVLFSFAACLLERNMVFLRVVLVLLILACLFTVPILTYILLIVHFYKSSYGSSAYLTRTLPVSQTKVYYSKFLTALIWSFLSYVIAFLLLLSLIALVVTPEIDGAGLGQVFSELWQAFSRFFSSSPWLWIIPVVYAVFLLLQPIVLYQFCCCAGNLRPFRRIGRAAPLLVYAIFYMANQILSLLSFVIPLQLGVTRNGTLTLITRGYFESLLTNDSILFSFPLFTLFLTILFTIVGFFLCRRWYARSINLR